MNDFEKASEVWMWFLFLGPTSSSKEFIADILWVMLE